MKELALFFVVAFPELKDGENLSEFSYLNNDSAEISLLSQVKMLSRYLSFYHEKLEVIFITNKESLIMKEISYLYNKKNLKTIEISHQDLNICNEQKDEQFQYAFAKLDCLPNIKDYLYKNMHIKHFIISDIDVMFFGIQKIIKFSENIKYMAAINYRNEQKTSETFDQIIRYLIPENNNKLSTESISETISNKNTKKLAWINSGFMIFNSKYIKNVELLTKKIYVLAKTKKDLIKKEMHWGDEIIFSVFFNYVAGNEIKNHNSSVARFIWTCNVPLPYFLNPFRLSNHIHLPDIKFDPKKLKVISKIGKYKYLHYLSALFINLWSIESRLYLRYKNFVIYKFSRYLIRLFEKLIILLL